MLHVVVRPKDGPKLTVEHQTGPLILGALRDNVPPSTDPNRLEWKDPFVSARHIELTPGWGNILRFRNISARNNARLDNGTIVPPNSERDLALAPSIPLLFTIGAAKSFNWNAFSGANTALSYQIFQNAGQVLPGPQERGWGAALTLVAIAFTFTVLARAATAYWQRRR